MSLDDLEQKDIEELVKLLIRRQQSRKRKSLCVKIGIDHQELDFIEHTSEQDFCVLLVDYLKRTGNQEVLCKLCCQELLPGLGNKESKFFLKEIIVKIECAQSNTIIAQSTTILDSIPNFKKKIIQFLSIFFFVLITIGFLNYNHPAITLQRVSRLSGDKFL